MLSGPVPQDNIFAWETEEDIKVIVSKIAEIII